jgi:hypothetical protein
MAMLRGDENHSRHSPFHREDIVVVTQIEQIKAQALSSPIKPLGNQPHTFGLRSAISSNLDKLLILLYII